VPNETAVVEIEQFDATLAEMLRLLVELPASALPARARRISAALASRASFLDIVAILRPSPRT